MKKELEEKLFQDFPLLYSGRTLSIMENLMAFGCECDSGWNDLIYDLSSKLEPLIQKWIDENPKHKDDHPKAMQVKEKFGGLRFYMTHDTDEMCKLIDKAEEESNYICETCGTKDKVFQTHGWIRTICEDCNKKRLDSQKKV